MDRIPVLNQKTTIFSVICLFVITISGSASPMLASGVENPIPVFYPELMNAPAPDWVAEGVRVSYDTTVSYGGADVSPSGYSMPSENSGTGAGITQLTIVGISGGNAAVTTDSLVPKPPYDTMHPAYSHGSVYPAGCGPFWINPDTFAATADQSAGTFSITRMPYTIGTTTYDAIRFDSSSTSGGGVLTMIYDLKTGLLLYHKSDLNNDAVFSGGGENYLRQSGSFSIYQIRNTRTMSIPWNRGTMPGWIYEGEVLSYAGGKEVSVEGAIGGPTMFPRSSTFRFGPVADRFVPVEVETISQDVTTSQSSTGTVSGISQIGGVFIPAVAQTLGTGTFDQDPDTGLASSITRNDNSGITVTKSNGADYSVEYGYDTNGKLVQMVTSGLTSTGYGYSSMDRTIMEVQE